MTMLSFYMVFSVLFDTFVVRTLLVPSLMSLCRDANWWPGAIPAISKEYDKSVGTGCVGGPCWCCTKESAQDHRRLSLSGDEGASSLLDSDNEQDH